MSIKISELKAQRAKVKAQMKALNKEIEEKEDAGDDVTDEDKRFKELCDRVNQLEARIAREEVLAEDEAKEAEDSEDKNDDDGEEKSYGPAFVKGETGTRFDPGLALGRKIVGRKHLEIFGRKDGLKSLERAFSVKEAEKIVKDLTSSGQPVVPQEMRGFIDYVRAWAVVRQFADVQVMENGNLTIPRQLTATTGSWINEGAPIPTSAMSLDTINLIWKKLAVFTWSTKEFLMYSAFDAAAKVTQDIAKQIALFEDQAYLTNATKSNNTPLGLPGMVLSTNSFTSNSANTFASITADLYKAVSILRSHNILTRLVWVMSVETELFFRSIVTDLGIYPFRDELEKGRLFGYEVFATNILPSNTGSSSNVAPVYLIAPEYLTIGDAGSYDVEETREGSFVTGDGTQINAFQSDIVAWKCANRVDIALTLDNALVQILGTNWSLQAMAANLGNTQAPNYAGSEASGAIGAENPSSSSSSSSSTNTGG